VAVLKSRPVLDNDSDCHFDLEWDDRDLFPDVLYPDADFLLQRTNEVTLQIVEASEGELILDIGSGRGIDGVELVKKGALVIGLEPSPAMLGYAEKYISESGPGMSLVRGVGESLPFKVRSADKVVCKGALDHFPQPDMVIKQMAILLKPEGKAIITIANFDSLGFRLARFIWRLRKAFGFKVPEARMPWEVPEDHTYRFNYSFLKKLAEDKFEVEKVSGVSLLFGVPWWGLFLTKLPQTVSLAILKSLDYIARYIPWLSDVVVMRCIVKRC
jgi:SAM-dependent methyltransferase